MIAEMLPASLLIKDYIKGEQDCNYEKYLLELINHSTWFAIKHPGVFHSPLTESNGECDAFNDNYKLDFKLFAASTALRAKNLTEAQIVKMSEGIIIHCESKTKQKSFGATRIFAVFRDKSIDDLLKISSYAKKEHSIDNDIICVLRVLETKKNILLFFPYTFSFSSPHSYEEAIESIKEGLNSDFYSAFGYREKFSKNYDTFLTCIYDQSFLIFRIENQVMQLIDRVQLSRIPLFTRLSEYSHMY